MPGEGIMKNRTLKSNRKNRKGAITVLSAILAIVLIGMVAFSVDVGYVLSAKEELQRSADATAMAACWEYAQRVSTGSTSTAAANYARGTAIQYAGLNEVTGSPMTLDANSANDPNGDIVFGYISDFSNSASAFQTSGTYYNAVKVRLHKTSSSNGEVPYFFARVFGKHGQVLHAEATAGIVRDVKGFQVPSDGSNVHLLPFALDMQTWLNLVNGSGNDNYRWNKETGEIEAGSDGWVEANLFPQGTGSPGNRGTVDFGNPNNSTSDLARQILHGVSPSDFAYHGGKIEFGPDGKLYLNGDTGISAGVKDELASIIGQVRVIPIFESVSGNGNNATYTIVKWQGIRVISVKLTGSMSQKSVMIQLAPLLMQGVIPSATSGTSDHVYSTVALVR
jgi:Flp pilus assembly protein TadG